MGGGRWDGKPDGMGPDRMSDEGEEREEIGRSESNRRSKVHGKGEWGKKFSVEGEWSGVERVE